MPIGAIKLVLMTGSGIVTWFVRSIIVLSTKLEDVVATPKLLYLIAAAFDSNFL